MRIVADNIEIARGERLIIARSSFAVESGEALLVTGPNGAGKTTLLRALAGFLPFAAGALRLEGGDGALSLVEQCHYLGHRNGLRASFTVRENLAFWTEFLCGEPTSIEGSLGRLAIGDLADIPVGYLSAGQRRRAALARLLAAPRPIWLLDEPTTSLDAASSDRVARIVDAHVADGGIVIASTHAHLAIANAREMQMGELEAA